MKAPVRQHYTATWMARIKRLVRMWHSWKFHTLLVGVYNWYHHFRKLFGTYLLKDKIMLPYDLGEIPLLGVYPREVSMYICTNTIFERS